MLKNLVKVMVLGTEVTAAMMVSEIISHKTTGLKGMILRLISYTVACIPMIIMNDKLNIYDEK